MIVVFVVVEVIRKSKETGDVISNMFPKRKSRYSVELDSITMPLQHKLDDDMVIMANKRPSSVINGKAIVEMCRLVEFI